MFIPDFVIQAYGEIWDIHGKFHIGAITVYLEPSLQLKHISTGILRSLKENLALCRDASTQILYVHFQAQRL